MDSLKPIIDNVRLEFEAACVKINNSTLPGSEKNKLFLRISKNYIKYLNSSIDTLFMYEKLYASQLEITNLLNKKMDWVYYDRDCAVYQLMAHNADNPRASEQDKLAFSRATYPERPKHPRP